MTSRSSRNSRKPAKRGRLARPAKPKKVGITRETLVWQGITVEVTYERDWMGMKDSVAHLQIRVLTPKGTVIPLTDTGYRSHFISSVYVDDAGGPVPYVQAWLDTAASTPDWKRREASTRQLSLF
jgi:hypothetical protein